MADMYHKLPQALTGPGGDQKELRVKYIDNLDGTWSLAIGALVLPLPDGAATSVKQDTTNTKLDDLITAVEAGGGGGGGVQYDAGDVVATPTGTVILARRADNSYYPLLITDSGQLLTLLSDADGNQAHITGTALDVNIAAGADLLATAALQTDGNNLLTLIEAGINNPTAHSDIMEEKSDDPNIIYVGSSLPGTSTASAGWSITRLDTTTLLAVTRADGDPNYDNIWDDRESLSYS